jgi:glycosyltransferase involved in cell wall biosynthesis
MKILVIHNSYQEPGGEDVVFEQETALLRSRGHNVITYLRSNAEISTSSLIGKAAVLRATVWSNESHAEILELLQRERPDVVHVHNTLPLISPSVFEACKDAGVPVVQTLHNYRLLCPQANLYRDGAACEECVTGSLWSAVHHGCYRQSRIGTAAVAAMLAYNRRRGTWTESVDRHIALTEFARTRLIQAGLPDDKVKVKPNFVDPDPGVRKGIGDYALFVGRLAKEKGFGTLLEAWQSLRCDLPLWVVGDGPERRQFEQRARDNSLRVRFLGQLDRREVLRITKASRFLVFPSLCYETFGMAIIEAYACGVPVIASRHGAMREIVEDGVTGLLFHPGNGEDLTEKLGFALRHPEQMAWLGDNGRGEYKRKYTAEINYAQLMEIYAAAMGTQSRALVAA